MDRINYSSGAKWEAIVGYSRAVKVGNVIEVTGTVAVDVESRLQGGDSAYPRQSRCRIKGRGAYAYVCYGYFKVGGIRKGTW